MILNQKRKKINGKPQGLPPSYSPDGKMICFVVNRDGTLNLGDCWMQTERIMIHSLLLIMVNGL
ncbi:MAG: hypothetical protein R3A12_11085 [Ignavibacteria bacterium]